MANTGDSTAVQIEGATVLALGGCLDRRGVGNLASALLALAAKDPATPIIVDLTGVPILDPVVPLTIVHESRRLPNRHVAIVTSRLSARQIIRRWAGDDLLVFPSVPAALDALSTPSSPV